MVNLTVNFSWTHGRINMGFVTMTTTMFANTVNKNYLMSWQSKQLHTAFSYLCRPTLPAWYSAGMTMILPLKMAVMQCTIQPMAGVQPVLTFWEDFLTPHLSLLTHAPSPLESTMYVCLLWCVCVFALWNTLIFIGTQNLIHETNKLKKRNHSGTYTYNVFHSYISWSIS